ncbi:MULTISPECIES: hypothetical protein [Streptomyces]|uniref:hypothetical protein n=1 Tax=Streptomyces TaxID=1883 RepID=UPI0035DE12D6
MRTVRPLPRAESPRDAGKEEDSSHVFTTADWGVEVTLAELKDIQLPESTKRAMARQAKTEREKRVKIIIDVEGLQAGGLLQPFGVPRRRVGGAAAHEGGAQAGATAVQSKASSRNALRTSVSGWRSRV